MCRSTITSGRWELRWLRLTSAPPARPWPSPSSAEKRPSKVLYIGYASNYRSRNDNSELVLPQGCGTPSHDQCKTQTALLLELVEGVAYKPGSPISDCKSLHALAFGDAAVREFSLTPIEERQDLCFCKWFKMLLHSDSDTDPDPVLPAATNGLRVTLSAAIAKTLEIFKEEALSHLTRTQGRVSRDANDMVWILTVPAIWSDRAKHMMRMAALDAGLIAAADSAKLILCLEPEGIAFHALFDGADEAYIDDFSSDETKAGEGSSIKEAFRRGSRFITIDAGGGTVDFGAYEVVQTHPFKVKHLAPPTGG